MPSLIGESVTLTVNFTNYADTFNNVDLVSQTFTVGAGVELQNIPVSYTFTSGGYNQTLTGSISVDVTASGYTVSFSGTQQGGQLSFILSSVADQSAGSITAASETASSGIMAGVNQTLAPSFSTANGGSVTAGFYPYGYQPGVSLSQTVAFTLADPTVPPAVTTNTGATVLEGGLHTITNTQLQTTDSNTVATGLTYRITTVATNGILFRDSDGDNVVDAGETRGLNNTFTQADIDAGRIKYLHNGGETTSASFGFSVTDGHDTVTGQTFNISVTPVNDAPTGSGVPATATVTEDVAGNLDLSGVTLADVDSTTLTLTLTASAGTMAASDGGGVTVSGSGSGTLTLSGTAADLQTYLDTVSNVKYTGAANANGASAASVSVSVGDGSATTSLGSVAIDITAVNDAPTGSGLPTDVTVTEDLAGNLDLSGLTLADVDSAGNLTLTLTATAGTMVASDAGSVTVSGSGSGTLTLTGLAADLNAYLTDAAKIQYTGALNASGDNAASVAVSASDGSDSRNIGTVNIDITAVNDAPTGSGLPTDVTVTEDTASNLNLTGLTVADVDSGTLTLTLTASEGTMTASNAIVMTIVDMGYWLPMGPFDPPFWVSMPMPVMTTTVTVSGSGSGTLTLTGSAADLNAYLADLTKIKYTGALNDSGDDAATLSVSVGDGTATTPLGTVNIDITAVDDAAVAQADAFTITDVQVLNGNVFADNGHGADVDVDGALAVTAVNGQTGDVGTQITLSSGALLTVNANGTFDYDPNGQFEHLPVGASASDSFTYAVNGVEATVTLTINGIDNNDRFDGTAGGDSFSGGILSDTLLGGAGDDTLAGDSGNDNLYGGDDNDHLTGGAGADTLFGDAGNDSMYGGADADYLQGNAGNDLISGGLGNDELRGGAGSDTIAGNEGADTLIGGNGTDMADYGQSAAGVTVSLLTGTGTGGDAQGDTLSEIENLAGSGQADQLSGDDAANALWGNAGADTLFGNAGDDSMYGGADADYLQGNAGNDLISGGLGNDELRGGAGSDTIAGNEGADTLIGGNGTDMADYGQSAAGVTVSLLTGTGTGGDAQGDTLSEIENLAGSGLNDRLTGDDSANSLLGNGGADTLTGNAGNDTLFGNDGDDYLQGNTGADFLHGGIGNDELRGGGDNDTVLGDSGNDTIYGAQGNDLLSGGAGDDHFVFTSAPDLANVDIITDFETGHDKIVLHTGIFTAFAGQGSVLMGDHLRYDTGTSGLYYDADGAGGQEEMLVATVLTGGATLTGDDFLLISG